MRKEKTARSYLPPFKAPEEGLYFLGCHVFSQGGRRLLLNESGYMLLMTKEVFTALLEKKPGEDLWFKLLQRRFAVLEESGERVKRSRVWKQELPIRPTFYMVDLTNRCNMGCRYCLRDAGARTPARIMTEEMVGKVCRYIGAYCRENGIDHIMVQPWGGEPLLEKEKIFLMQEELEKCGVSAQFTIETNGLLIDDALARELYERRIAVSVSIDGFALVHDGQRTFPNGGATHRQVEAAIRILQRYYGENVSIIATITKYSAPYVEEILEYFARDLGLKSIKINYVHKSAFQEEDEFCMTEEEIQKCAKAILRKIIFLQREGVDLMEYNLWIGLENLLTNRNYDVCNSRGCCGGRRMITFDVEGNLYPCDVTDFSEERMGNMFEERSLTEIVEAAVEEKPYFREKYARKCEGCPWRCYCRGGCTVHTKCAGETPGNIDRIQCSVNRVIYPGLVDLILEEPKLVNRMLGRSVLEERMEEDAGGSILEEKIFRGAGHAYQSEGV